MSYNSYAISLGYGIYISKKKELFKGLFNYLFFDYSIDIQNKIYNNIVNLICDAKLDEFDIICSYIYIYSYREKTKKQEDPFIQFMVGVYITQILFWDEPLDKTTWLKPINVFFPEITWYGFLLKVFEFIEVNDYNIHIIDYIVYNKAFIDLISFTPMMFKNIPIINEEEVPEEFKPKPMEC